MVADKPLHTALGLLAAASALAVILWVQVPWALKMILWIIVIIGFLWAWVIGHAWMVIPGLVAVPFFLLIYAIFPPVKIRRGRAFEGEEEILAYCLLTDRIVVVREFPTLESIEGHSLFLPKKVFARTRTRLAESDTPELPIDEKAAQKALGRPLPDLNELDRENVDRNVVDSIHEAVGELWKKHKNSDMENNVLHLAAWYALAADQYFRHAERSFLEHAIL